MTLHVMYVPTESAAQSWAQVEPYVAEALKYANGDYTVDQMKLLVCTGQQLLLVAVDDVGQVHGAATISFINYPNDRVAFITAIGGKFVIVKDTFLQMCRILGMQGATKIQGAVRPAMAKLCKKCGFSEVAALVEVRL